MNLCAFGLVMRVHPSSISSSFSKWQIPIAIVLLVILLLVVAFRGPKQKIVTQAAPTEKKVQVVVARAKIEAGQPLEKADVVLEQRPMSTLPADAITALDTLKNKVAAGPIPAGYPLAMALLADPVVVLPKDENKGSQEPTENPIDILLKQIEPETVALSLAFNTTPPGRGARMAVTLANSRGESIIVAEECWVASATGREAVVRLDPVKALLIQSSKGFGVFGFIEIPTEGASPYAGKAIGSLEELRERLEGKQPIVTDKMPKTAKKMQGCSWIPGEGRKYCLDQDGSITVVEE